jgi:hypothetical protein
VQARPQVIQLLFAQGREEGGVGGTKLE